MAAGGVVVGPAHHHLTLQVHGGEAVQEVEGAEFEADNVWRWLSVGFIGLVLHTPGGRQEDPVHTHQGS